MSIKSTDPFRGLEKLTNKNQKLWEMYFKGAALMYDYKRGVLDKSKEMVARQTSKPSEAKGHRECWHEDDAKMLPSEAQESVVFLQLWKLVQT